MGILAVDRHFMTCSDTAYMHMRMTMKLEPINILKNVRLYAAFPILVLADMLTLAAAMSAAFLLRFEGHPIAWIYGEHVAPHGLTLALGLCIYLSVFAFLRLYRYAWRFAGLETLLGIVSANAIGLMAFVATQALVDRSILPVSVLIIFLSLSVLLIGTMRILLRVISISLQRARSGSVREAGRSAQRRVVILGGADHPDLILKAINREWGRHCRIIGLLDDNPKRTGKYIGRVRILGPLKKISQLLADKAVDEVVMAVSDTHREDIRNYVLECRDHKVAVKTIPQLEEILSGRAFLHPVDFSVDYLLHRQPVTTDYARISRSVSGKRVLVTGAGGSIGSELCRQIAKLNPSLLVLLGHGENSIYNIYQELRRDYPELSDRICCTVASVCNQARIDETFEKWRPELVFHASAHKHVPIMESNVKEAVCNNVFGTHSVAAACAASGVQRMVMISTDKAADPSCIMGATKWLCEEVTRTLSERFPNVSYISVRFGNVLGSRGSVVPLFKEQIKRGGPVTVTHPDMTRYFMTIPEAVELVLQAGAIGQTGSLYLLDMGNPVRMLDVAKDMIRLSGFEPGLEIPIEFTGVRPGEKLHERLVSTREKIEKLPRENLHYVHRPRNFSPGEMDDVLKQLRQVVDCGTTDEVRHYLHKIVPGFEEHPRPVTPVGIAAHADPLAA